MAKRAKKENAAPKFEEALEQLQQIVGELEEGSGGLEHSLKRFEEGIGLLRTCYQTLEQAEQKIELLTAVDEQGNLTTAPFDATSTVEQKTRKSAKKKPADDEDGGSLF
ncbi:Exodeoxyribonuclease 7 small subunit [Symmachiella dynata]|uniref:Exodeoxyribonuclease 7 small subunit n=1 Tax=Symmachiella dynata TaxID=2527995 RepID=A0A517ZJE9_9PLAN|nr:exodeoxyribonuclease VII small subunit [Symmachiella dynata]QDU42622.1 Exodeoxyribonuclease 7 small subunit [Symmachiella dynata]